MTRIVDFKEPPVVETVVGVQFEKIPSLRNAHLGHFWKSLGDGWPNVADAPPLPEEFEKFGAAAKFPGGFQVQFSSDPSTRMMIKNAKKDRLIQVQNGRLHVNWLGSDGAEYPHYTIVRAEFLDVWGTFREVIAREIQKSPKVNQWEVTYVNWIPRGTLWDTPSDFSKAFSFLADNITVPCGPLESASAELNFEIAPERGRLHVQFGMRESKDDRPDKATLTLTARGPVDPEESATSITEGLDCGREAIVRAFKALTTDEARRKWGEMECR